MVEADKGGFDIAILDVNLKGESVWPVAERLREQQIPFVLATGGHVEVVRYLLAEGAVVPSGFGAGTSANLTSASLVCNGNTAITGIGRAAAQRIWYVALTEYMCVERQQPHRIQARGLRGEKIGSDDDGRTGFPGGSGADQAKCRSMGLHQGPSLYLFGSSLGSAVHQASKHSASIAINAAAPLSIAALCASVRGRMRAK